MTPKECEAKFQEELKKYRLTGNSKSWEWIWICVQECCSNTIKSKAKGLVIPDFDGKVTDSVIKEIEKFEIEQKEDWRVCTIFFFAYVQNG